MVPLNMVIAAKTHATIILPVLCQLKKGALIILKTSLIWSVSIPNETHRWW